MESSDLARDKKKAQQQQSELAYQDEAGVCLLPSVGASYAPCGERPVILADSKNKLKVSLSVVITPEAELYYEVRQGTFNGAAIVRFLKKMKQNIKKKLTLIWDGASIHGSQPVKEFLQEQQTQKRRVWLEKLPTYSPELNGSGQPSRRTAVALSQKRLTQKPGVKNSAAIKSESSGGNGNHQKGQRAN